jgi:hypothetical protein
MMRRWGPYLAIAVLYVGLIFILQMWIRPVLLAQAALSRDAVTQRYSALHNRVMFENNELRRAMLRDSLQRSLPAVRGVFVSDLDSATEYVQRVLRRELPAVPEAAVGVIGVAMTYGLHPGVSDIVAGRTAVTGERAGIPFCVVTMSEHSKHRAQLIAQLTAAGGLSGQCHFFAQYGAPGRFIRDWLAAGGGRYFARHNDPQINTWRSYPATRLPPNFAQQMRRGLPVRAQKCLSGHEDVCAQLVASFEMTPAERELHYRSVGARRLVYDEGSLLAALEKDFGAERFRRFWRSDRPFQEAFEQSFGVPLGKWVYDWTEPLGHARAGPGLDLVSITLTLLLVGALLGAGMVTAQNRRI